MYFISDRSVSFAYREKPERCSWGAGEVHKRLNSYLLSFAELFVNREQTMLLNGKTTNFDWNYFKHDQKLKFLIRDLLLILFVTSRHPPPPPPPTPISMFRVNSPDNLPIITDF